MNATVMQVGEPTTRTKGNSTGATCCRIHDLDRSAAPCRLSRLPAGRLWSCLILSLTIPS